MTERIMGPVNAAVAGAAVSTPWWLAWVYSASEAAAIILPIMGVILAGMQMYFYWKKHKDGK